MRPCIRAWQRVGLDDENEETLFLQGTLKQLVQILEVEICKHGDNRVGHAENLPWERELGHECTFMDYFFPSPMYGGKFLRC